MFLTVKLKFHQKKLHETFFNSMRKTYLGSFTSLAPPKASSRELHLLSSIPRPHLGRLHFLSLISKPHLGSFTSSAPSQNLISAAPPPQLHPKASSRELYPLVPTRELHLLSPTQSLISEDFIPQPHLGKLYPIASPTTPSRKSNRFSLRSKLFLTGKPNVSHYETKVSHWKTKCFSL